jgi:hypothetical protein
VAAVSTELPVHRLDAEHYGLVVDSGALDQQRDGIIVQMSPHSPAHAAILERLTKASGGRPSACACPAPAP